MTYTVTIGNGVIMHTAPDDSTMAKWMAERPHWWLRADGYVCIDGKHHDDLQRFIRRNA